MKEQDYTQIPRLLIVDDEPENINSLLRIFKLSGYELITCNNGKDAIDILKKQDIDLILMDVRMPVLNGFQTCELIKKEPNLKHLPVVFLTSCTDSESIIKGLQIGGIDYITKPFNSYEVLVRVKNYINLKKADDQIRYYNKNLEKILQERTKTLILAERQAAVSLSIQGILHNLKNPLTAICAGIQIVLEIIEKYGTLIHEAPNNSLQLYDDMLQKTSKNRDIVLSASDKLTVMINSILVKGRKDRQFEFETVDLNNLLKQEQVFIESDNLHNLKYKIFLNCSTYSLFCKIIPVEIAQVFHNLVKNIFDALAKSNETVEIKISSDQNSQSVWFEVSDNGPGIPVEFQEHLFEPFYTTKGFENQDNGGVKGTGLGLYSCWELVTSNMGKIELTATGAYGTTFRISFPKAKSN